MDLVNVQRCVSALPWWTTEVESQSEPGKLHKVSIPLPTDDSEDFICDCPGFEFRGHCRHIQEVTNKLCRWDSLQGPEEQTPDQEKEMICPRCGDETIRITEFI